MAPERCCVCTGYLCNDPDWYSGKNDLAWVSVLPCGHQVHMACADGGQGRCGRLAQCPLCRRAIDWDWVYEERAANLVENSDDEKEEEEAVAPRPPPPRTTRSLTVGPPPPPGAQVFQDPATGALWWWIDNQEGESKYGSCGWLYI